MKYQYCRRYAPGQSGLTLIEIMVALVIGSFLMIGAMSLFMSNKRIYNEQDAMGRLQENARFAVDLLTGDTRIAGYLGCSDDSSTVTNTLTNSATATHLFNFTNPIEGSENAAIWLPSNSGEPAGSSDGITLRYIMPLTSVTMSADMTNGAVATNIPVSCTPDCTSNLSVGEPVVISDCASTDIFELTAVNADNLVHGNAPLSKGYTSLAQISRYVTNRYYIGNGTNGPALFRYTYARDLDDIDSDTNTAEFLFQSQELIEGVESMQILYGVDNNTDTLADSYVNANDVVAAGGWDNVVSVQLALLLRTVNEDRQGELNTNTYNLLGTVIDPVDDYRRRRVYSTIIQIRNRSI